jgi:predicted ATPase
MSSIKIKNFGPIQEGFLENDGFLPIDKLMIFIGGQGSGKSSIVKLISTLTWIEKALVKKNISIEEVTKDDAFRTDWCKYQFIQNYFKPNTYIEYRGKYIHFKYDADSVEVSLKKVDYYEIPKITYIPAERNFLSVLDELENIKALPPWLSWTLDGYLKACLGFSDALPIHINDIEFQYSRVEKTAYISGDGFENLKLSEASSGIQSVVPMMVVSYYLHSFINDPKVNSVHNLSFAERQFLNELMSETESKIIGNNISTEESKELFARLPKRFLPQYLFTIIEEMEQNLFPESQKDILFKSLEFNNDIDENYLIITTHSPYIIAYTTLAMKAFGLYEKANGNSTISERLEKIVPKKSIVDHARTGIYQIDAKGTVISIKSERGLIKDNNYLNESLAKTDDLFDDLLDIQQELCQ